MSRMAGSSKRSFMLAVVPGLSRKSTKEGGKIRRPVVIDIVGPKDNPCHLLQ